MKNNSENKSSPQEDEKIHISKSIFETNREMKQKAAEEELKKQAERERILAEKKKKAEEERTKRLEEERLELIRLKQGIIEESDTIKDEEPEAEEVKRTLGQKISSFFYLNKWWLTLTAIFGTIAGILIHSYVTRPNPDVTILIIGANYTLGEESELKAYAETFIEDYNENGKIEAAIHYIPYTGQQSSDYANAAATRLSAELQSDNCAIIIGNKIAADMLGDNVLVDLTELYPDNELVQGDKLMLENSSLAEKIGVEKDVLTSEWFIGIREPHKLMHCSEKKMLELYEKDFPLFDAIVNDISE